MKIAGFANSVDLNEVAHDELPHLELHCVPSSLGALVFEFSIGYCLDLTFFENLQTQIFMSK